MLIRLIFFYLAFATTGLAVALPAFKCDYVFSPEQYKPNLRLEEYNGDFVMSNGVAVTGDFVYSLDFVYSNLDINPSDMPTWKNKTVVSFAEGASGLVPSLLAKGIDAAGVDLVYDAQKLPQNYSGNIIREYMHNYGSHLFSFDARSTPFATGSVDVLLSHMLVNNVNRAKQQSILREVLRVLNPQDGEARIYGFGDNDILWLSPFIAANCSNCSTPEFKVVESTLKFRGRSHTMRQNLLVIKRH